MSTAISPLLRPDALHMSTHPRWCMIQEFVNACILGGGDLSHGIATWVGRSSRVADRGSAERSTPQDSSRANGLSAPIRTAPLCCKSSDLYFPGVWFADHAPFHRPKLKSPFLAYRVLEHLRVHFNNVPKRLVPLIVPFQATARRRARMLARTGTYFTSPASRSIRY